MLRDASFNLKYFLHCGNFTSRKRCNVIFFKRLISTYWNLGLYHYTFTISSFIAGSCYPVFSMTSPATMSSMSHNSPTSISNSKSASLRTRSPLTPRWPLTIHWKMKICSHYYLLELRFISLYLYNIFFCNRIV